MAADAHGAPGDVHAEAARRLGAIEAELARLGMVPRGSGARPSGGERTFESWLVNVFVPQVRVIVAQRGDFPASSGVGVMAARAFEGRRGTEHLVSLLRAFDRFIQDAADP